MPNKKKKVIVTKAIVLKEIALSPQQKISLALPTPNEFIKERKARGGKIAKYVEGGYVISQLNLIFGVPNWDFDVMEHEVVGKQVWVKGKLTIIDHKNGFRVSKTQFGQHDIVDKVPLGDTLKAASTDCLKKCASLFGIALDVYWQNLDSAEKANGESKKSSLQTSSQKKKTKKEMFEFAKKTLNNIKDINQLVQMQERLKDSKIYEEKDRLALIKLCKNRSDKLF